MSPSILERARHDIETHGWHCVAVGDAAGERPPFAYTVGLKELNAGRELALFGLPPVLSQQILGNARQLLIKRGPLQIGDDVLGVLAMGVPLRLLGLIAQKYLSTHFGVVDAYHRGAVSMGLLVWPNRSGVFPPLGDTKSPQAEGIGLLEDD